MSAQPEVWRVSTPEGIFETDLETLKQWIGEGCVLPTDKVSKGNLSWIEAGRVPKLKGAFEGDMSPAPTAVTTSFESFVASNQTCETVEPVTTPSAPTANVCQNHPEAKPEYVCRMCGAVFCKACPKIVDGKVAVCSACGDLCHEYRAVTEKAARIEIQSAGFGVEDFVRALRYPLQHKVALLTGALIYGTLLWGGLRGSVLAWGILFGCMSHGISQVAWGRFQRSFMPDFTESSLWDEVVLPLFLGIGIIIVSWGPLIVLVFALLFGPLSDGGAEAASLAGGEHVAESTGPDLSVLTDPEADAAKLAEENRKLQELRPGGQMVREAEEAQVEAADPMGVYQHLLPSLRAGATMGFLLLVFAGWGLFYQPMALAVAGYTQSVGSVLNPLVGLDTIRRMRGTYFKAFAMVIAVQIMMVIVGAIIGFVTSPFAFPIVGNPVGNFVYATFTFYFDLVIACILGLALFKCADRLGINVD